MKMHRAVFSGVLIAALIGLILMLMPREPRYSRYKDARDDFGNFKALVLRNAAFLEAASQGQITMDDFVQRRKDQDDISKLERNIELELNRL